MAKGRIKGITIEIGGDTTGLQKALEGVNSKIRNTQSQLADVNRELKFNPTSTELLSQKQRLLAEAVSGTREKLEQLRSAEKQVQEQFERGEISREKYDALKREIIETEDRLKALEKQAAQSNATLAKIGAVTQSISQKASGIASATKGLSAAAGGALAAIGGLGIKAAVSADDLNTLAKQTGLTTETLQEAQYAADLIDVSYEAFTGSINKMVGKLRTNEDGFNELGIATRDAAGELLSTEEIFFGAADALSKMENETERDIAAQELFGKSAAELAGILDDGGKSFRELGEQAKNAGYVLDSETLDGLNAVNDKLDTLKANIRGTLAVSGAKALEALTPVLEKAAEAIGRVLDGISKANPETLKTVTAVLAVVAAISPVAGIIGKIAGAVAAITPIISALTPMITGLFAIIAANPVIATITGIAALLFIFRDDVKAVLQTIKESVQNTVETIREKIAFIKSIFTELPREALQWGKDLIQNFIKGITEKAQALVQKVKDVAQSVRDFLGFSEPKLGPLSDFHTYAPDMMKLYAKGIRDNAYMITDALGTALSSAPLAMQVSGTANGAQTAQRSVQSTVNVYPQQLDASALEYIFNYVNMRGGALA